jgi:ribA/ribD-fused uncharacterized protein
MISSFSGKWAGLCNFYPCSILFEGRWYRTTEHAFVAAKNNTDLGHLALVKATRDCWEVKAIGRKTKIRPDWEDVKYEVMKDLVFRKFDKPTFKKLLMETGDEELVEGNTWGDETWGMIRHGFHWVGKNWLGKLLMEKRACVRSEMRLEGVRAK